MLDHFRAKKDFRSKTVCILGVKIIFCPKWPTMVLRDQKQAGLPFGTLLDPFGPLWNVETPAVFPPFLVQKGTYKGTNSLLTGVT